MRWCSPAAALCLLLCAAGTGARALTLDDLLNTEELGNVGVDPSGRWLVIERRGPYAEAPRFDGDTVIAVGRTGLWVADLKAGGGARPLLLHDRQIGYRAGPFSPDGAHLVVFRLRGRSFELGVVEMGTGEVRWLGVTPDIAPLGRAVQWRSNSQFVLIARQDGDLPKSLRNGSDGPRRIAEGWDRTFAGLAPAATAIGSGADLGRRPRGPIAQLLLVDIGPWTITALAPGDFDDLEISPGGRHLAVLRQDEDLQPQAGRLVRVGDATRRRSLVVIDLQTRRPSLPCPLCDVATQLLSWSPDGRQLLIYARKPGETWEAGGLAMITAGARSGDARLRGPVRAKLSYTSEGIPYASAGWIGRTPVVLGIAAPGLRNDWYALGGRVPRNLTGAMAQPPSRLADLDVAGLTFTTHADDSPALPSAIKAEAAALGSLVSLGDGNRQWVNGRLTPRTQRLARAHASWSEKPQGRRVEQLVAATEKFEIIRSRDPQGVETLMAVDMGGAERPLLTLNAALSNLAIADVRPIAHLDPSGKPRVSWLYLPPGHHTGVKLPLVVLPYPGSVHANPPALYGDGASSLQANPQLIATHGYAVLVPSLPRDRSTGEPGAGLANQILAVVDAAVATGAVDPDRLAIWGHSFGGYTALMVAAQTKRFRSVIAKAGAVDPASLRGAFIPHNAAVPEDGYEINFAAGWTETGQASFRATPWDDPDRYVRNSPLAQVGVIGAPVLLIAGDQDEVSITQSQAMFSALYRQGKDAQMVTYWGERHLISSPANLRDYYARAFAWLAATLKPSAVN